MRSLLSFGHLYVFHRGQLASLHVQAHTQPFTLSTPTPELAVDIYFIQGMLNRPSQSTIRRVFSAESDPRD
jgi:hypothetical protein